MEEEREGCGQWSSDVSVTFLGLVMQAAMPDRSSMYVDNRNLLNVDASRKRRERPRPRPERPAVITRPWMERAVLFLASMFHPFHPDRRSGRRGTGELARHKFTISIGRPPARGAPSLPHSKIFVSLLARARARRLRDPRSGTRRWRRSRRPIRRRNGCVIRSGEEARKRGRRIKDSWHSSQGLPSPSTIGDG